MAKTIQERPPVVAPSSPSPTTTMGTRVLVGLLAFTSLFFAIGAAYGFGLYVWADAKLKKHHYVDIGNVPCHNGCNFLVLGSDSRAGLTAEQQSQFGSTQTVSGHRSDTIMLVHLDSSRRKAVVVSFPRDLWVNIPNWGWDKLTSAYAGGPNRVAKTLENLTGLSIDHFVGVNLASFENVVNALGGVRICVDQPMEDVLSGINLPHAGCYTLDGYQALAFVRTRHIEGDCIPDFSRIGRQQQFLRAVIAKVLQPQQLLHAPSLVKAVFGNLLVDDALNPAEIIHLTKALQGVSTGNADFRAVPGTTGTIESTGQSVVFMAPEAKLLFKRLENGAPLGEIGKDLPLTPRSPANVKVRVYDDSSAGRADQVNAYLQRSGFDVYQSDQATALKHPQPGILYQVDTKLEADRLHGFLPTLPEISVPKKQIPGIDAAVVIPATYNGPPITPLPPGGTSSGEC